MRLGGVYQSSIIRHLNTCGLNHFTFDLRPRSLNFTQIYKIKEMISENNSSLNHFYIHFENEKDFMINGSLEDIIKAQGQAALNLEFSGTDDLSFYEQFQTPYVWHFNENISVDSITNTKYLRKISFDQLFVERLLQFGRLYELFGDLIEKIGSKNIDFEISAGWDSAIMETLIDFYPINTLRFEINNQVEKSYRQIDLHLVQGHIEHTKRTLNF